MKKIKEITITKKINTGDYENIDISVTCHKQPKETNEELAKRTIQELLMVIDLSNVLE